MSSIQVGDIVRHTNWPDLTLLKVLQVGESGFSGEVVYGTGPKGNSLGIFPLDARSLPKGYRGAGFAPQYLRKATVDELIYAGLPPAPETRPHTEYVADKPDWSQAPEGATHWRPHGANWYAQWVRYSEGQWYWCSRARDCYPPTWRRFNGPILPGAYAAYIARPNEPRPHADLIKAWADGAQIEMFCELYERWVLNTHPQWNPGTQYRIRPAQPKGPTREQLLKSGEASKRKYLKRKAELEAHKARLRDMMAALDEQYAQKKIRREALLRNT